MVPAPLPARRIVRKLVRGGQMGDRIYPTDVGLAPGDDGLTVDASYGPVLLPGHRLERWESSKGPHIDEQHRPPLSCWRLDQSSLVDAEIDVVLIRLAEDYAFFIRPPDVLTAQGHLKAVSPAIGAIQVIIP